MIRTTEYAREEDGVITIQYDDYMIASAEKDEMLTFFNSVDMLDCYLIGEQYCISNFDMAFDMYENYSDLIYSVPFSKLEDLKQGKKIELYGHTPDDDEREMIENKY